MTAIINRSKFTTAETITFLRGMAWPALTYPLAASAIDRATLEAIQSSLIQSTLRSLHYNKNFPRALTFGPIRLGGLNLPHLYASQGQGQVLSLLRHARSNPSSLNYQTTWSAIRWIQQLVGSQHSFLSSDYTGITSILPTWYRSVKEFLISSDISCILTDHSAKPQRTGDVVLMDHPAIHRFTPTQTLHINAVRLYLTVETLADLATADGTRLRPGVRQGSKQHIPPSTKLFPRQPKQSKDAIRNWNDFITQVVGHTGHRLSPPLGSWTDLTQRRWSAVATRHHIALKNGTDWNIHTYSTSRRFLTLHHPPVATVTRLKPSSPVDTWHTHGQDRCSIPSSHTCHSTKTKTLHQFFES